MRQYDVYLVGLDPTIGSEMRKTGPCVIVSPDELNARLNTVVVVPLTSTDKPYPFRPAVVFKRKTGSIALDRIRSVDKTRLIGKAGRLDERTAQVVAETLVEIFAQEV